MSILVTRSNRCDYFRIFAGSPFTLNGIKPMPSILIAIVQFNQLIVPTPFVVPTHVRVTGALQDTQRSRILLLIFTFGPFDGCVCSFVIFRNTQFCNTREPRSVPAMLLTIGRRHGTNASSFFRICTVGAGCWAICTVLSSSRIMHHGVAKPVQFTLLALIGRLWLLFPLMLLVLDSVFSGREALGGLQRGIVRLTFTHRQTPVVTAKASTLLGAASGFPESMSIVRCIRLITSLDAIDKSTLNEF